MPAFKKALFLSEQFLSKCYSILFDICSVLNYSNISWNWTEITVTERREQAGQTPTGFLSSPSPSSSSPWSWLLPSLSPERWAAGCSSQGWVGRWCRRRGTARREATVGSPAGTFRLRHTSYLSILAHQRTIQTCFKYVKRCVNPRHNSQNLAQTGQNFAFSRP